VVNVKTMFYVNHIQSINFVPCDHHSKPASNSTKSGKEIERSCRYICVNWFFLL